jgi:hypothetical protein
MRVADPGSFHLFLWNVNDEAYDFSGVRRMQQIQKKAFVSPSRQKSHKSAKLSQASYFALGALLLATAVAMVWVFVQMARSRTPVDTAEAYYFPEKRPTGRPSAEPTTPSVCFMNKPFKAAVYICESLFAENTGR